jgi:hypothetical protein
MAERIISRRSWRPFGDCLKGPDLLTESFLHGFSRWFLGTGIQVLHRTNLTQ